jgi:hypothetical protein
MTNNAMECCKEVSYGLFILAMFCGYGYPVSTLRPSETEKHTEPLFHRTLGIEWTRLYRSGDTLLLLLLRWNRDYSYASLLLLALSHVAYGHSSQRMVRLWLLLGASYLQAGILSLNSDRGKMRIKIDMAFSVVAFVGPPGRVVNKQNNQNFQLNLN